MNEREFTNESDQAFNVIACRSCRTRPCQRLLRHHEANPIPVFSADMGKPDCIFVADASHSIREVWRLSTQTIKQVLANLHLRNRVDAFRTHSWSASPIDGDESERQILLRLVEDGVIQMIRAPVSQTQVKRFREWFNELGDLDSYSWLPRAQDAGTEDLVKEELAIPSTPPIGLPSVSAPSAVRAPSTVESKSGIARSRNVDEFVNGFKQLKKDWAMLTEDERRQRLKERVNKQLKNYGVPEVGVRSQDLPGHENGHFSFTNWELVINQKLVSKDSLTDDEAKSLANTLYHESRHAEQWYRMARKQAADGKSAKEIRNELGMPGHVAKKAASAPLDKKSQEYKEGVDWYNSVYGQNRDARNKTLKELPMKIDAYNKAVENYQKVLSDPKASPKEKQEAFIRQQTAYSEMQKVYQNYRNLPEEQDAWATGDSVSNSW